MKKVIAACLCLPLLGGCFMLPAEEDALPPPVVYNYEASEEKSVEVSRGDLVNLKVVFANKTIMQKEELKFTQSNKNIAAIYVAPGDMVVKGDIIAELECQSLLSQLSELRLKLRIAELEVVQLEESYALERKYSNSDSYSGSMEKAFVNSKNNITSIKRSIEALEEEYENWIIRAPYDGLISRLEAVRIGDSSDKDRAICTIESDSGSYFVLKGNHGDGVEPDSIIPIVINEIEYQALVIKGTQLGHLYLEVLNAGDADFSNVKFASVKIVIEETIDALLLPAAAVFQGRSSKYVYRLVDGKKVFTEVTTGMEHQGMIEIISGLVDGDVITARGL